MRNTRKSKWKKVAKTERFNLHQSIADPRTFEVSWKRSESYGRRRFQAPTIEAALEEAPRICGFVAAVRKEPESFTLADAFAEALAATSRGEKSKSDWLYYVERFIAWLGDYHPRCTHWHLLTRQIVREYLETYKDKSDTTKRLSLQPIRQTSGFMSREHGYQEIASRLGVGSKLKEPPREVYLADVLQFLEYLRRNSPRLEAGAALQGLAGLQLQEALRLTWDRVDLEKGLVEISGVVKNLYRNRVIPVADRVLDALRRAHESQRGANPKVEVITGPVLISAQGCAYDGGSWMNYSKELSAQMRAWNSKLKWQPKDLRNCLMTLAGMEGLGNDMWEMYVGHAPRSVTARHYIPRLAAASLGETETLERRMNVFRTQVTDPLNNFIAEKLSEGILKNFERPVEEPTDEFNALQS